jgi:hypothetical protein
MPDNCPSSVTIGENIRAIYLGECVATSIRNFHWPSSVGKPHYENDSLERPEESELAKQREWTERR